MTRTFAVTSVRCLRLASHIFFLFFFVMGNIFFSYKVSQFNNRWIYGGRHRIFSYKRTQPLPSFFSFTSIWGLRSKVFFLLLLYRNRGVTAKTSGKKLGTPGVLFVCFFRKRRMERGGGGTRKLDDTQ